MVMELSWSHNRARLWCGESPSWCDRDDYPATKQIVSRTLGLAASAAVPALLVALEILVPRGGRAEYAALMATLKTGATGTATITVEVTDADGPAYVDSLAKRMDTVRLGLPAEYAQAIADSAAAQIESAREGAIVPGRLITFARALHGEVGSSQAIFASVARSLCQLLVHPQMCDSDAATIALLQREVVLRCLGSS